MSPSITAAARSLACLCSIRGELLLPRCHRCHPEVQEGGSDSGVSPGTCFRNPPPVWGASPLPAKAWTPAWGGPSLPSLRTPPHVGTYDGIVLHKENLLLLLFNYLVLHKGGNPLGPVPLHTFFHLHDSLSSNLAKPVRRGTGLHPALPGYLSVRPR